MPTISQFYGIKIYIFFDDHNQPHFHAYYAEHEVEIAIKTGKVIGGKLPPRATKLVADWMKKYKMELLENWELAKEHKRLKTIKPLE